MASATDVKARLEWFRTRFLKGQAQAGWAAALKRPSGFLERVSVFDLWDKDSRRSELCVFWGKSIEELREALRGAGCAATAPLVVGTGHGVAFGSASTPYDEVFSRSFRLLEGLVFFGNESVLVQNHDGGLCVCFADERAAKRLQGLSRGK